MKDDLIDVNDLITYTCEVWGPAKTLTLVLPSFIPFRDCTIKPGHKHVAQFIAVYCCDSAITGCIDLSFQEQLFCFFACQLLNAFDNLEVVSVCKSGGMSKKYGRAYRKHAVYIWYIHLLEKLC